jgi:hypothetical protein
MIYLVGDGRQTGKRCIVLLSGIFSQKSQDWARQVQLPRRKRPSFPFAADWAKHGQVMGSARASRLLDHGIVSWAPQCHYALHPTTTPPPPLATGPFSVYHPGSLHVVAFRCRMSSSSPAYAAAQPVTSSNLSSGAARESSTWCRNRHERILPTVVQFR